MRQQALQIMLGDARVEHGVFLREMAGKEAKRQLGNRLQLRIAGVAQAFLTAKRLMIGRHQMVKRAESAQQLLRQLHYVHTGQPGAQENGQQLCVGQRRGPLHQQLFTRRQRARPARHSRVAHRVPP